MTTEQGEIAFCLMFLIPTTYVFLLCLDMAYYAWKQND